MENFNKGPKEIIDAGIDYLTMSIPHSHPKLSEFIWFAEEVIFDMERDGYMYERKKVMQYNGTGNEVFFYGRAGNWDMLRVSGHHSKEIADGLRKRGLTAKPTRVDFQLTTRDGCGNPDFAERLKAKVRRGPTGSKEARRSPVSCFSGASRDTGITIGSRTSQTYIRIYDAHSKHRLRYPAESRRVETEYKGSKAASAWERFMTHGHQNLLAQQLNAGELEKRGILEPWMLEVIPQIPAGMSVKSSDEKTLWWLANQVVPVIKRLMKTKHGPYIRTLFLDAIGPQCVEKGDKRRL